MALCDLTVFTSYPPPLSCPVFWSHHLLPATLVLLMSQWEQSEKALKLSKKTEVKGRVMIMMTMTLIEMNTDNRDDVMDVMSVLTLWPVFWQRLRWFMPVTTIPLWCHVVRKHQLPWKQHHFFLKIIPFCWSSITPTLLDFIRLELKGVAATSQKGVYSLWVPSPLSPDVGSKIKLEHILYKVGVGTRCGEGKAQPDDGPDTFCNFPWAEMVVEDL